MVFSLMGFDMDSISNVGKKLRRPLSRIGHVFFLKGMQCDAMTSDYRPMIWPL
jgi:hypothetical protein